MTGGGPGYEAMGFAVRAEIPVPAGNEPAAG